MANVRLDNMHGQITLLKSSLEGLGVAVYESNNAALTGAVEQAKEYVNQLTEAFNNGGFSGLVEQAGTVVADMATKIAEQAPALVNAAKNMLLSFSNAIITNAPALANSAINIVTTLVNAIITLAPSFLETGLTLVVSLAQGLADALPQLIPSAIAMIFELVDTLLNNIDAIVDAAINLIMGFADGLMEAIPIIVEKAPQIISKLVDAIIKNAPKMALIAPELYLELAKGLVLSIGTALTQIPPVVAQIVGHFKTAFVTIKEVGKDVVEGLWNGIKNSKAWLLGKIKEWCGSILAGVKAFFGIHSPSRVMRDEVGRMLALGIAGGITDGEKDILTTITSVGDSLIGAAKVYNARLAEVNAESAAAEAEKEETEYKLKLTKAKTAADKEKIIAEKQAKDKKNLRKAELDELKRQAEAEKKQRDKAFETLDRASNLEIISQKEYYDTLAQLRDRYFEKGSSDWWKYTEKIIKYGKDQIKELKDYATTYSNDISKALKNYTTERDDLINPFAEKLSSADIYDTIKIISGDDKNGSKVVELHKLKSWKEDIERLNIFDERISRMTDRMKKAFGDNDSALNEFLEMIRNDPFGEGEKILSIVEKESDENVFDFVRGWGEYKDKAVSISERNHRGQLKKLEQDLYTHLNTLKTDFSEKLSDIMSGIPEDFKNWGKVSAEMFNTGFLDSLSEILSGIGDTLSSAFGKVLLRPAGSYNSVDNSKTNNINVNVSSGGGVWNENTIGRKISNILWLGSVL